MVRLDGGDMSNSIIMRIKEVISKVFGKESASKRLGVNVITSTDMTSAINLWCQMYQDNAPWLNETTKSLCLPSAIASEIAKLVTIEFESEISGKDNDNARAAYLNEQYQPILDHIRIYTEYACAKGGIFLKPYVDGDKIRVNCIQADYFLPTAFDNSGKVTGGIFFDAKTIDGKYYTRVEYHDKVGPKYHIVNKAFVSMSRDTLGREINLQDVPEWADIEQDTTLDNIERPLFAYFKIPLANTIDSNSPLGVSVYSRAIDLIEEADKQYSRLLWEFEGGELALDVDSSTIRPYKDGRGTKLPKGRERLFRKLELGDTNKSTYNIFAPPLRDTSYINGLNKILQRIEFNCGLAYGTFSDPQQTDKTAEEIRASKQRSYATVSDIQKAQEAALRDLIYAIDTYCTLYNLAPAGSYDVSFNYDDSIVVDSVAEQAIRMQEVSSGILSPVQYLMWRYGVTEQKAREMMPDNDGIAYEDDSNAAT